MKDLIKKIIPDFLFNWYHFILSMLGAILYEFPSKKIKVIGVAGTDGKTTTTSLIVAILEQAGYKVASISSIRFKIGDKEWKNTLKMTMPGRFNIQRFLRNAVSANCQYAVLEVTDEGIKQHRHRFIDFKTAVLTNITPEHIEAHGSFEKMRQENEKLFQIAKEAHIINLDDENAEYFLRYQAKEKWGYKIKTQKSKLKTTTQNLKLLELNNKDLSLKLPGEFNLYNAMAAICVGLSQGIDLEVCKKVLEKVEVVPGRMEVVIKEPFQAIIDYAHTVNALEKVYQTLINLNFKPYTLKPKMICVLGACGGGRDRWKRPEFGRIAAKYCDKIILTNEDPYDENPLKIIEEIESGFSQIPNSNSQIPKYEKILDRREAIKRALKLAKLNDIVIITGKGRESWICVAEGKKIPWDDGQVVKEEFQKLKIKHDFKKGF
jgi:UDP-N-acetylmuramyl-tripeptide synthetase